MRTFLSNGEEIIKTIRFGKIGIVKVKTEYGQTKVYIGEGEGFDEEQDAVIIATRGMRFSLGDFLETGD